MLAFPLGRVLGNNLGRLVDEHVLPWTRGRRTGAISARDVRPTPTGRIIVEAAKGRIPAFVDTGLNLVHVDDVASGHLAALRHGTVGERYILGGQNVSFSQMLADVAAAFSGRDIKKAIEVLRADAEMDRLRNLIFLRHIENPENVPRHASLQVIFMTQSLERAGDHAKNLAEEVCHVVSGHTVRHVLMTYDKPIEQLFLDWLRNGEEHQ